LKLNLDRTGGPFYIGLIVILTGFSPTSSW